MTMDIALGWSGVVGYIGLVLVALMWLNMTIGILCVMEVSTSWE